MSDYGKLLAENERLAKENAELRHALAAAGPIPASRGEWHPPMAAPDALPEHAGGPLVIAPDAPIDWDAVHMAEIDQILAEGKPNA